MCIAMNNIVVINKIAVKIEIGNTPLALFFSFSSFRVYFVHVLAMTRFRFLGFKKASRKIAWIEKAREMILSSWLLLDSLHLHLRAPAS